jgi:hypothetical protein
LINPNAGETAGGDEGGTTGTAAAKPPAPPGKNMCVKSAEESHKNVETPEGGSAAKRPYCSVLNR